MFTRLVESELIWMKYGALGVHCWGLVWADFRRDSRSIDSVGASRIFVFFSAR